AWLAGRRGGRALPPSGRRPPALMRRAAAVAVVLAHVLSGGGVHRRDNLGWSHAPPVPQVSQQQIDALHRAERPVVVRGLEAALGRLFQFTISPAGGFSP